MGYFRELPNLLYQSFLPSKNSSLDYIEVKNLFRRAKIRDDLQSVFTLFTKYEIPDGYRPENVAEDYYGSDELDWVVLLTANGPENTSGIINVRNDWPLSNRNLYEYASNKYGNDLNTTRFYETKEIRDSEGHLILPAGQTVNADFKSPLPLNQNTKVTNNFESLFSNIKLDPSPDEFPPNIFPNLYKNAGKISWTIIDPLNTEVNTENLYYTKTENYGKFELNLQNKTWSYEATEDGLAKIEAMTSGFVDNEKIITDTLSYTNTDGNNRIITIKIKVIKSVENGVSTNRSSIIQPTILTDIVDGFTPVSYVQYWDKKLNYNVIRYGTDVRSGVSNLIYETRLNNEKRSIFLLKPEYLQQFLNDFRDIMVYNDSSEFITDNLIKTANTNLIDS